MKKSQLRKLIREVIKNSLTEEIVHGIQEINKFCNGCTDGTYSYSDCCNMHDYGGVPGINFWADLSCGACQNFPVGTIFDSNGNPIGNSNERFQILNKGDFSDKPNNKPKKLTKQTPLKENKQLLTEEITCNWQNTNACRQYIKTCINGGGYIQTDPDYNNAEDGITIWCVTGGMPTDNPNVITFNSVRDFDDAIRGGTIIGVSQTRPTGNNFKKRR